MFDLKTKEKQPFWPLVGVALGIAAILFLVFFSGTRPAVRSRYTTHEGWSRWSASYSTADGSMRGPLHPLYGQNTLHGEVTTDRGRLSIRIVAADGRVLMDEDDVPTGSFDIPVVTRVTITMEASQHSGGFRFRFES